MLHRRRQKTLQSLHNAEKSCSILTMCLVVCVQETKRQRMHSEYGEGMVQAASRQTCGGHKWPLMSWTVSQTAIVWQHVGVNCSQGTCMRSVLHSWHDSLFSCQPGEPGYTNATGSHSVQDGVLFSAHSSTVCRSYRRARNRYYELDNGHLAGHPFEWTWLEHVSMLTQLTGNEQSLPTGTSDGSSTLDTKYTVSHGS